MRLFSPQQSLHRSDVNAQCLPDWKGSPWLANQEKLNKRWQKKLANRHRIAATFSFFAGEDPTGWMESLKFRAINSKDLRIPENATSIAISFQLFPQPAHLDYLEWLNFGLANCFSLRFAFPGRLQVRHDRNVPGLKK